MESTGLQKSETPVESTGLLKPEMAARRGGCSERRHLAGAFVFLRLQPRQPRSFPQFGPPFLINPPNRAARMAAFHPGLAALWRAGVFFRRSVCRAGATC